VGTPDEVYANPKSPFVFSFLGSVNLFHGRVHEGQAKVGSLNLDSPEHAGTLDSPIVGYVRPHDLEVLRSPNGHPTLKAQVRQVLPAGPFVRLKLEREDTGDSMEAEITRDQFRELALQPGDQVHVRPKKFRVFLEDYSI
jgi:sulfate/thiosulfate transport system ATP-binding protein